jgi:hypothetical protein
MMNGRAIALAIISGAVLAAGAAFAQEDENPTTPGAIPNPGTYQGSMQMQAQSDRQDQQFRQQQSQQSTYSQPTYPRPNGGGGGYPSGSGRRSAPPPEGPRPGAQVFGKEAPGDIEADRRNARGDYAGAIRLWRPLAEAGDVNAAYNMGVMYDEGHGVSKNDGQAAIWYRRAADKGMGPAMLNLVALIANHARTPADLVPAYMWLVIAQANAPEVRADVDRDMSRMMSLMSYRQITQAENLARNWKPR